jgi:hypothetical protein
MGCRHHVKLNLGTKDGIHNSGVSTPVASVTQVWKFKGGLARYCRLSIPSTPVTTTMTVQGKKSVEAQYR